MTSVNRFRLTLVGLVSIITAPVWAGEPAYDLDIEPQPLAKALKAFAEQSGLQVVYYSELADGEESPEVSGTMTADQAMTQLLASTDLTFETMGEDTVVVETVAIGVADERGASDSKNSSPAPVLMAQNQTSVPQTPTIQQSPTNSKGDQAPLPLEEIVVIGTNIRGIAPESSPVRIFDRNDILNSGAATAQDFIQTLPSNFGGGSNSNIAVGLPTDFNSSENSGGSGSLGSSVNLRGLGSGSTLVLLNGRRVAPSSGIGDFVDISMIPASAIERVEVLSDGASSIYGADAVAGVVNFVLRDDFNGIEVSLRYGTVTDGNFEEQRYSLTAGEAWEDGNALLIYEYFKQSNLSAGDREFSQDALLPTDLIPSQERHNILISANQELSAGTEIFGDFIYSTREAEQDLFNVFTPEPAPTSPTSESLTLAIGGSWNFASGWYADLSGTFSDVNSEPNSGGAFPSKTEIDSTIWTTDAKISGDIVELPGGDMKLALGGQFRRESFKNVIVESTVIEPGTVREDIDRDVTAFFGEVFVPIVGTQNAVPGIQRLEFSLSGRFEDYDDFGSTADPKIGVLWSPIEPLKFRASYSTSFNPPPLGQAGASDLLAITYPTALFNALLGLTPGDPSIADVTAISVSGTGKGLKPEESRAFAGGFDYMEQWGQHSIDVSATFFDIDFEGRLGSTPIPGNALFLDAPNIAFNSPELFPEGAVVFFPSQSEISQLLDTVDQISPFPGTDPLDAAIITTVNVVQNLGRSIVRGVDFDVTYTYETDAGDVAIGLDGTYLADFQQQAASTSPRVERLNTLFNPVDLKLRGRVGLVRDRTSINFFINYTDSYKVDNTPGTLKIGSWTTADLSLTYNPGGRILDNTVLRVAVSNLFDEAPPAVPSDPGFFVFGYDVTNANPRNRFVAIELAKVF